MAKVTDAVIVCALVLVLDVTAGLLGLAQAARNQKVKNCDIVQGYLFGKAALILFSVALVSENLNGACDRLCPQMKEIRASMGKWVVILAKWITGAVYGVGGVLLVGGIYSCKFRHGHLVTIGAILCFVHSGITIAFYMPVIVRGCRDS